MNKNSAAKITARLLHLLLAAFLSAAVCAGALPVLAAGPEDAAEALTASDANSDDAAGQAWTQDYYRASDTSGDLTDAEQEELETICIDFMRQYHADLALVTCTNDTLDGYTLEDLAAEYYASCGFGYGEGRDGFQMVYNLDTDEAVVVAFGAAKDMVPAEYLAKIEASVPQFREKYGVFGPFYSTTKYLNEYMEQQKTDGQDPAGTAAQGIPETQEDPDPQNAGGNAQADTGNPDPMARVGEGSDMPAWYPVNPGSFPAYHDADAPRVVDTADLFTAEEEMQMEKRLAIIRGELEKDIVIFTDVSSYGLGHDIYSADFYDFNGYGIGDEYEGVVLFICMDPNDRGWWASCAGPETRGLYTEEVANQIDDLLYEYLSEGNYYEGAADWIENFRRLYRNGSPYLDDWISQDPETFERYHNEGGPRVIDEIGLFTESELSSVTELAQDLSRKYDIDVVIHTALNPGTLSSGEYSERYYCFGGYGVGEGFDGIELTIFKRPGYIAFADVYGSGICAGKLTETNRKRLERRCSGSLGDQNYFDAAKNWIGQTDHMMKTGRAPQSAMHWIVCTIVAAVIGCIYGGISLNRAADSMETPKIAENANAYYVEGSLKMRKVSDTFVDLRTTRQYSPRQERSSGGGGSSSGGRSSYRSSYSGSSGRTHSGSGRKF